MILVYKNGVRVHEVNESDYPAIANLITENEPAGVIGIVFRDTDGTLTSYVKGEEDARIQN